MKCVDEDKEYNRLLKFDKKMQPKYEFRTDEEYDKWLIEYAKRFKKRFGKSPRKNESMKITVLRKDLEAQVYLIGKKYNKDFPVNLEMEKIIKEWKEDNDKALLSLRSLRNSVIY